MLSVEAILFDLDGTLIDSKKDLALSIHFLQEKYHCPPSPEADIARFIGDGVVKLVERALTGAAGVHLDDAVEQFKAHYRQHALDHTRAYAGAAEALAHFRLKKMAVVTNKPSRISKHILEQLGLARYFSVILGGDSVEKKKPDPEGLLAAMTQLGVSSPRQAVMVGDSAQDVQAGKAAGIWTCGVFSNIGDPDLLKLAEPDYTVNSLSDLMRIIN